jgi:hypothetical protein
MPTELHPAPGSAGSVRPGTDAVPWARTCRVDGPEWRETATMLRLLHLADVHLGARHAELGAAGAVQRERQWLAFERALELAAAERCALVLLAGDLFDSNAQPRRAVERAARILGSFVAAGGRVVLLPGDSDPYDAASVYRTYDLAALAGLPIDSDGIHVLTPGRATLVVPALDLAVRGYATTGSTPLDAALAAPQDETETGVRLRVGIAHAAVGAGGAEITKRAVAASGLDYLALGGAMALRQGAVGTTRWADPGPPELVDEQTTAAGQVLLVTLDPDAPERVQIEPRTVGRTRRLRLELAASDFDAESALATHLAALADPDLACDVRLTGERPSGLHLDEAALEAQLGPGFLHLRIRDASLPPEPAGPPPAAESIAGAFARDLGVRIANAEAEGREEEAHELREQRDLGLRLLAGSTGMPV